jgi:hypothetical protein
MKGAMAPCKYPPDSKGARWAASDDCVPMTSRPCWNLKIRRLLPSTETEIEEMKQTDQINEQKSKFASSQITYRRTTSISLPRRRVADQSRPRRFEETRRSSRRPGSKRCSEPPDVVVLLVLRASASSSPEGLADGDPRHRASPRHRHAWRRFPWRMLGVLGLESTQSENKNQTKIAKK